MKIIHNYLRKKVAESVHSFIRKKATKKLLENLNPQPIKIEEDRFGDPKLPGYIVSYKDGLIISIQHTTDRDIMCYPIGKLTKVEYSIDNRVLGETYIQVPIAHYYLDIKRNSLHEELKQTMEERLTNLKNNKEFKEFVPPSYNINEGIDTVLKLYKHEEIKPNFRNSIMFVH
jgi:hypothetical protein